LWFDDVYVCLLWERVAVGELDGALAIASFGFSFRFWKLIVMVGTEGQSVIVVESL
jgi:hypothetical protein